MLYVTLFEKTTGAAVVGMIVVALIAVIISSFWGIKINLHIHKDPPSDGQRTVDDVSDEKETN